MSKEIKLWIAFGVSCGVSFSVSFLSNYSYYISLAIIPAAVILFIFALMENKGYVKEWMNASSIILVSEGVSLTLAGIILPIRYSGASDLSGLKTALLVFGLMSLIMGIFILILRFPRNRQADDRKIGNADELFKYKELLDKGIISQTEFDEKKRQLLGL